MKMRNQNVQKKKKKEKGIYQLSTKTIISEKNSKCMILLICFPLVLSIILITLVFTSNSFQFSTLHAKRKKGVDESCAAWFL